MIGHGQRRQRKMVLMIILVKCFWTDSISNLKVYLLYLILLAGYIIDGLLCSAENQQEWESVAARE